MTIKEKIRQFELGSGSGSTVGSDASKAVGKGSSETFFARPPPGCGIRLNDFFMPRKMEFNGWVTDCKQCSYQGLTETEVSNFIKDLINSECILIGIKPGLNKEHDRPKPWSVCGSAMKPICQRWSGCWTSLKRNSRRTLQAAWTRSLFQAGYKCEKETSGEGQCFVLQRPQRGVRG